ncbi:ImmA/IrrE family metallo-endopeptidase [Corynebacterium nasicanis]|uniref:ImmA/IrrE family metallo-endopeptidase n=1 Tax=Corynebacterium nasicanis TaxID=1448267 RepID=A0ABW1QFD7_9CORY
MKFRQTHGLGEQPLGDLVTLIDQTLGYDVAVVDIGGDPDQHGMTLRDTGTGAVFIGVAATHHPMRQRSTLAHEVSHVLHDDWEIQYAGDLSARPFEEIRADAFARHLLIPQQGITDFLRLTRHRESGPLTLSDLSAVVQHFLVSPALAAIALCDHGVIDDVTKDEWRRMTTPRLATRFGWSDRYAALARDSSTPRVPQRLVARAIAGYEAGVISAQTIATLRSMPVDLLEEELLASGIRHGGEAGTGQFRASQEDLPAITEELTELIAGLDDE